MHARHADHTDLESATFLNVAKVCVLGEIRAHRQFSSVINRNKCCQWSDVIEVELLKQVDAIENTKKPVIAIVQQLQMVRSSRGFSAQGHQVEFLSNGYFSPKLLP